MTYIIAEPCIDIKDKSCVDVCPVDCIHEAERILVIDPEECIDCGACEPECPVEAIFPEDALPDKWQPFVKINYAYGEGLDVVNNLTDEYATEHDVHTLPVGVVNLDERLPLVGKRVLREDRLDRALGLAGPAVDALLRVDDEDPVGLVDAIDGTDVDARAVFDVDARLRDDVGHGGLL